MPTMALLLMRQSLPIISPAASIPTLSKPPCASVPPLDRSRYQPPAACGACDTASSRPVNARRPASIASKVIAADAPCNWPERLRSDTSALAMLVDCCSAPAASMNAAPMPTGRLPASCPSIADIADSTRAADTWVMVDRLIPATALATLMRLMLRKTLLGS